MLVCHSRCIETPIIRMWHFPSDPAKREEKKPNPQKTQQNHVDLDVCF